MKVPKARKLKSGNWFIQLRLGGESISITEPNEKDCIRKAQHAKAEHLAGLREKRLKVQPGNAAPTLTQAIDNFISARTNTLSPVTIRGYRIIQKNRFQDYMNTPVDKLTNWQKIINQEAAVCSPKTLKNAWGLVRSVLKEATGEYPPEVKLPSLTPPNKPYLTPQEIKVFVSAVKDTKYAIPCLLGLCSLRASEIQALDWKDIPKDPEFIRVSGAVVPDENNQRVKKKQNKNASSTRNVPVMIPELRTALERERKPTGPVLTIHQNSLRRAIEKICKENGLPNVGIHGLRHSFASLAYHLQIPEKIAMEIGGWSDATTMHKIYTHISKSDINRYKTAMTEFYSSDESKNQTENGTESQETNAN